MKQIPDSYCKDHIVSTSPFLQWIFEFLAVNWVEGRLPGCRSCNLIAASLPQCQDQVCLKTKFHLFIYFDVIHQLKNHTQAREVA